MSEKRLMSEIVKDALKNKAEAEKRMRGDKESVAKQDAEIRKVMKDEGFDERGFEEFKRVYQMGQGLNYAVSSERLMREVCEEFTALAGVMAQFWKEDPRWMYETQKVNKTGEVLKDLKTAQDGGMKRIEKDLMEQ